MSMSTHVYGIRPPDEDHKKMKAAFDGCIKAGVNPPKEVWDYFNGANPDPVGVVVDLEKIAKPWRADMQDGFEIDLSKLPKGIKLIRFVNSY